MNTDSNCDTDREKEFLMLCKEVWRCCDQKQEKEVVEFLRLFIDAKGKSLGKDFWLVATVEQKANIKREELFKSLDEE